MINKLKKLSLAIALMLIATLFPSSSVMGQEDKGKITFTKDEAVKMAINNNSGLKKLDITLNSLVRNFNEARKLNDVIEKQMDMIEQYESLYDKYQTNLGKKYIEYITLGMQMSEIQKQISGIQEQIQKLSKQDPEYDKKIEQLNATLGNLQGQATDIQKKIAITITSEEIEKCKNEGMSEKESLKFSMMKQQIVLIFKTDKPTRKQKYDMLIKNKDMYLSLQSGIQSMKIQTKSVKNKIDTGVRKLYDTVIYLEDAYELQKNVYDKQVKDCKQMEQKYEQSQISELELTNFKMELEKCKFQFENMKRTLDNTKFSLKQMCGINIEKDIQLVDKFSSQINKPYSTIIKNIENKTKPLQYDEYLKDALKNKEDILIAKVDLDNKKRIYNSADEYLSTKDSELVQLKQDYDESSMKYNETVNNVKKDIQQLYMEMKNKKYALDTARKKFDKADKDYNSVKQNCEQGFVSLSALRSLEIAVNSGKMNYIKAVREYENAIYSLKVK